MIDDETFREQMSKGERHRLRLVALFAAPVLLGIAVLYARALTASLGAHFGLDIIRANALVIAVVFALFTLVIALRFVFFVRMPFKLMWAASLVVAVFVALLVVLTAALGSASDPLTVAMAPLRSLVDEMGDRFAASGVPPTEPSTGRDLDVDDAPPPSNNGDEPPPEKPVSRMGREDGDFEWAWSDAEGNFHVTSEPPPEGAKVLSKVRRK